jgi:hypothetical protein
MAVFYPGEYEVSENSKVVRFYLCPRCKVSIDDTITTSSSDFAFCAKCHQYSVVLPPDWEVQFALARLVSSEPCDCMERFGRVQHHDGGHYHYDTWDMVEVLPIADE